MSTNSTFQHYCATLRMNSTKCSTVTADCRTMRNRRALYLNVSAHRSPRHTRNTLENSRCGSRQIPRPSPNQRSARSASRFGNGDLKMKKDTEMTPTPTTIDLLEACAEELEG